jgi:pilus assembly protein CpaF
MFLIQNNRLIHRFDKSAITIGRAPGCDLVVNASGVSPKHVLLTLDADGNWRVKAVGADPVFVGASQLVAPAARQLHVSDVLRLGNQTFVIRDAAEQSEVAWKLDDLNFDLQLGVHRRVLDTIKKSTAGLTDKQLQDRMVKEIDAALDEVKFNPDLESHLAIKALKKLLHDRAQSYKKESKSVFYDGLSRPEVLHAPLLAQAEKVLQLDGALPLGEKVERIESLTPWAVQKLPFAGEKRRLALGLVKEQLLDIIFGFGPLEDLMNVSGVNDIMVLPSGKIFVDSGGRIRDTGRRMLTPEVALNIIQRIVTRAGRRVDKTSPMVDARVSDGSRLNAIIEPLSVDGPALTIRRFMNRPFTMKELTERGSLTETVANFLHACVRARKNIVISGGTGSGKTTLLNALAGYIPEGERIISIEDTAEMKLNQPHVVSLQGRPPNVEGKNAIPIRKLVRNALRMRPDRIIVGECRGGEALDMLQAMNTGHDGSLTTVHANMPADAVRRIEVMSLEAEDVDLPSRAIREQIASAIDLIVQVTRYSDGSRRVSSVCEVVGFDEEDGTVIVEEVYQYRWNKRKRGMTREKLSFTGHVPTFVDDLINTGIVTVSSMF